MSVVEGLKIQIHVCGTYVLSVWFSLLIGFSSVWIFSRNLQVVVQVCALAGCRGSLYWVVTEVCGFVCRLLMKYVTVYQFVVEVCGLSMKSPCCRLSLALVVFKV